MNAPAESGLAAPTLTRIGAAFLGRLLFAEGGEPRGEEQAWLHALWRPLAGRDPGALLEAVLADPPQEDRALVSLARALELHPVETVAAALALAVEEEVMMGRVLAHLQAPVGGSRPTLGLLAAALAPLAGERSVPLLLAGGNARRAELLVIGSDQAPLAERELRLPLPVVLALRGGVPVEEASPPAPRPPPSVVARAEREARALTATPGAALLIRAARRAEGWAVAREIARALGRRLLPLDERPPKGTGLACRIAGLLPLFRREEGEGRWRVPELPGYEGPVVALAGIDEPVAWRGRVAAEWVVLPPAGAERERLWREHLGDEALARRLAREQIHGFGRIDELATLARRRAAAGGREAVTGEDLRRAAWEMESGLFGGLAQPLPEQVSDGALVVAPALREELARLLERCRLREALAEGLGEALTGRYRPGVRALLVGPSGTGKTLAAGWIATRLGLPLYRVDLASVVSKYVGETEKNLAELLARAEESDVILLFDEADALFGKRTEVRDANDRFANSQTNYLLQRIESHRGIVLLTSNSRDRFDAAFTRRLDRIVEFPLPRAEERRALWRVHLGDGHRLDARQINRLAALCDLPGGHIRNTVLEAAVEARHHHRPIAEADLIGALEREYRKLGRQMPVELKRLGADSS